MYPRIYRSLALLLAGAIAGLVGSLLVQNLGFSFWLIAILLIVLVLLVLLGIGMDSFIIHHYRIQTRKKRATIGILNDMGWFPEDQQVSAGTDISPKVWLQAIEDDAREKKAEVRVGLIKSTDSFTPYAVVINPYGGVYPEQNLASFATLDKIFSYVQEGGLFVNVAATPGYWVYHPLLKKRMEATVPVWHVDPTEGGAKKLRAVRLFSMVPWMKRLGLMVWNVEGEFKENLNLDFDTKFEQVTGSKLQGVRLHRLAMLEENVEAVCKMSVLDGAAQSRQRTPIFFATYGNGAFLISLIFITPQVKSVKEGLKRVIVQLILSKVLSDSH